jgi:hypothetical protein
MRISPGPGSPTGSVDELHLFRAAEGGDLNRLGSGKVMSDAFRNGLFDSAIVPPFAPPRPASPDETPHADAPIGLLLTLPPLMWAGNAVVGRLAVGHRCHRSR